MGLKYGNRINDMRTAAKEGHTLSEAVDILGIPERTLRRYAKRKEIRYRNPRAGERIDETGINDMRTAAQEGSSKKGTAETLKRSRNTIAKYANDHGIEFETNIYEKRVGEIRKAAERGYTLSEASIILNIQRTTLRRKAEEHGINFKKGKSGNRPRNKKTGVLDVIKELEDRIREDDIEGALKIISDTDIETFFISREALVEFLKRVYDQQKTNVERHENGIEAEAGHEDERGKIDISDTVINETDKNISDGEESAAGEPGPTDGRDTEQIEGDAMNTPPKSQTFFADISPEQKKNILELLVNNITGAEIAEKLGIPKERIKEFVLRMQGLCKEVSGGKKTIEGICELTGLPKETAESFYNEVMRREAEEYIYVPEITGMIRERGEAEEAIYAIRSALEDKKISPKEIGKLKFLLLEAQARVSRSDR